MRKADRSLFGRWLETEINSRGMTQTEFAVASGVPVATLSRWMNDDGPFEIRGQNRQKLSDFLGVPVDVIDAQSGIIDRVTDRYLDISDEECIAAALRIAEILEGQATIVQPLADVQA